MEVLQDSTAWHVVSTALAFGVSLLVCLKFGIKILRNRNLLLLLFFWHLLFFFAFRTLALATPTDAGNYYISSLLGTGEFDFGTRAIVYFVTLFSIALGLSFTGTSVVFWTFGLFGFFFWAEAFRLVLKDTRRHWRIMGYALLFLPSVHIWTSAIGKDTLFFLASGMVAWELAHGRSRLALLGGAILLAFFARPHTAALLTVSLLSASLVAGRGNLIWRVLGFMVFAALAVILTMTSLDYVGLGGASVTEIGAYVDGRQLGAQSSTTFIDLQSLSMPMRFYSYLFRPDAVEGLRLGTIWPIIGLDNLILLLVLVIAFPFVLYRRSRMPLSFRIFALTFFFSMLFVLSNTTPNLGIASRQKWMFILFIYVLLLSYLPTPKRHTS